MSPYEDAISQLNTLPADVIVGGILLIVASIFGPAIHLLPQRMKLNTIAHLRSILRPLPIHKGKSPSFLQIVAGTGTDTHTSKIPRPALRTPTAAKSTQAATGVLAGHNRGTEVASMLEQLQQSQAALRQSEAKYRGLVEQIPVVVYEADVDEVMTTTYISPVIEELLGYPADVWIHDPSFWYEHVHPDDRLKLKHATLNAPSQQTHLTSEYRLLAQDGRTVWVRDEGRVIRDAHTGRLYLQGAMLDITARKEAEAQLRQVEATYQQFIEQLPVTTYIALPDAQNSVVYISPQIEMILGFQPREFLDQPDLWARQIHSEDRERVVAACQAAYKQGQPYNLNYRMITRHGQRVFIHDEFWPIFNAQGHIAYLQGVMQDITARHLAEERSKAFSELGAQLSATTDVSQAADIILQVADRLLNWDAASISLSAVEDTTLLRTLLMIDTDDSPAHGPATAQATAQRHTVRDHETRLLPGSLLYRVLEDGTGRVLSPAEIAQWNLRPFGQVSRSPSSVLLVPLRNGARVIGLVSIQSYRPAAYSEADLDTLQALAGHCGGALERIWAEQMLRNQQATLQTISNAVSGRLNLAETLNDVCYHVNQQLGTDAAGIVLLSADGTRLACVGSDGFYESQHPEFIPVEGTAAGQAIREQRTIHVQQFVFGMPGSQSSAAHAMMRSRRYESSAHTATQTATHTAPEPNVAYLGVPLMLKDRPVGVLELFRYIGFPTHSQWQNFLESLAHQVAVAIDSAQLFQDAQRANQELAQAYGSTIEGWSRALEMRDPETEGHSQRVTAMTVRLAQHFGFDGEQIEHIRYGALLHDIGKLAIPDHILFNVGPLSQDEWAIMRRHPEYARDMLAQVDYLKSALDIPYAHHERWDGNGYPLGLQGEQIPLAARLFAVVDVWDALRSNRRYREGLPDVTVFEHLRAAAGVSLDPQVVERFLQLLQSQREW